MRLVILTLWIGVFVGPFIESASADAMSAKAAADAGNEAAQFEYGLALENGDGVPADVVEAHKYYVLGWKQDCVLTRNMGCSNLRIGPRRRALMLRKEMTEEELKRSHPHAGADAHRGTQSTLRRAAR